MSTLEGFTTAFGDLAAPPGGTVSPTYVAMATSNIPNGSPPVMAAQAVLLVPRSMRGPLPPQYAHVDFNRNLDIAAETATATRHFASQSEPPSRLVTTQADDNAFSRPTQLAPATRSAPRNTPVRREAARRIPPTATPVTPSLPPGVMSSDC